LEQSKLFWQVVLAWQTPPTHAPLPAQSLLVTQPAWAVSTGDDVSGEFAVSATAVSEVPAVSALGGNLSPEQAARAIKATTSVLFLGCIDVSMLDVMPRGSHCRSDDFRTYAQGQILNSNRTRKTAFVREFGSH
jgi:hypothetical protein